jgi:single-strand DNA-binding protein
MSNLRNSVRLMGFLGNDPEVKSIGEKKKVARVSIATNDSYKNDKGEKIEETQWHNLVLWDRLANLAESFLHKGSEVSIEGKLSSRSYTDKEGTKRYITEVVVHDVQMLGKKGATAEE